MAQYIFGKSKKVFNNNTPQKISINENDIAKIIMSQYDHFNDLKLNNSKFKYLSNEIENISNDIINHVGTLNKMEKGPLAESINVKLGELNSRHKKLENEYIELLKIELNILYTNWPSLFEQITTGNGIDRTTLEHVLNTFSKYKNNEVSPDKAVEMGVDFMTNKYNLPKDFFNKDAIKEYIPSGDTH
jgi:hypothetical protein